MRMAKLQIPPPPATPPVAASPLALLLPGGYSARRLLSASYSPTRCRLSAGYFSAVAPWEQRCSSPAAARKPARRESSRDPAVAGDGRGGSEICKSSVGAGHLRRARSSVSADDLRRRWARVWTPSHGCSWTPSSHGCWRPAASHGCSRLARLLEIRCLPWLLAAGAAAGDPRLPWLLVDGRRPLEHQHTLSPVRLRHSSSAALPVRAAHPGRKRNSLPSGSRTSMRLVFEKPQLTNQRGFGLPHNYFFKVTFQKTTAHRCFRKSHGSTKHTLNLYRTKQDF
jgi:hypothetical protein